MSSRIYFGFPQESCFPCSVFWRMGGEIYGYQHLLPSLVTMILFIALPIGSVFIQSLHIEHGAVFKEVKNCGPFGCKQITTIDVAATDQLRSERPLGQFSGFDNYTNRSHLAFDEVSLAWEISENMTDFIKKISGMNSYKFKGNFIVTYKDNVVNLIKNTGLREFAKENGYDHRRLSELGLKKRKTHKDIKKLEFVNDQKEN